MILNYISVDIQLPNPTGGAIDIYFYRQTWSSTGAIINGLGYPIISTNKLTISNTIIRQWPFYTPTSSTAWKHATDKLLVVVYDAVAGTKFHGIRINATWHSVNKWAPAPAL